MFLRRHFYDCVIWSTTWSIYSDEWFRGRLSSYKTSEEKRLMEERKNVHLNIFFLSRTGKIWLLFIVIFRWPGDLETICCCSRWGGCSRTVKAANSDAVSGNSNSSNLKWRSLGCHSPTLWRTQWQALFLPKLFVKIHTSSSQKGGHEGVFVNCRVCWCLSQLSCSLGA